MLTAYFDDSDTKKSRIVLYAGLIGLDGLQGQGDAFDASPSLPKLSSKQRCKPVAFR